VKTPEQIQAFLFDFKKKSKGGILYLNNGQSILQNVAELNLDTSERKAFLDQLTPAEYCSSAVGEGTSLGHELWVFGRTIKKNECYIKVTLCLTGHGVFCYSFQAAKNAFSIPLTKKHEKSTIR
jgi:hypothetical protein